MSCAIARPPAASSVNIAVSLISFDFMGSPVDEKVSIE
jgi:hypothetical protein